MNIGHHRKGNVGQAHRRGVHDDGYNKVEARNDNDAVELEMGKGNRDKENRERGTNNNGKAMKDHTPHRANNTKIQLRSVRGGIWAIIVVAAVVCIWLRLYYLDWTGGQDVASMEEKMLVPSSSSLEQQTTVVVSLPVLQETGTIMTSSCHDHGVPPSTVGVVEIGTSDFDTLLQASQGEHDTGLSVDAMEIYIDRLPNKPCWKKLVSAVVGTPEDVPESGLAQAYFVHPSDINKYGLPEWIRGCNSINRPHPTVRTVLGDRNLTHLQQNKSVPVISVSTLLDKQGICRIGTFKVRVLCVLSTLFSEYKVPKQLILLYLIVVGGR